MRSGARHRFEIGRCFTLVACAVALAALVGCGTKDSTNVEAAYAACDQTAPAAYRFPVESILDPTTVLNASPSVKTAFAETVRQRPGVGLPLSQQGSVSADSWIVLRALENSVYFGGVDRQGQVTRWFNSVRANGKWKKARLSDCEMVRVIKNGQFGPVVAASRGRTSSSSTELELTIRKPFVGCDYASPEIETLETNSSVTVSAKFLRRKSDKDVICVSPSTRPVRVKAHRTLLKPLGSRHVYDGSFVPKRPIQSDS